MEVVASVVVAAVMATPSWVPVSRSPPIVALWMSVKRAETRNAVVMFSCWVRTTGDTTKDGRSLAPVMVTVRLAVAVRPT